MGDTGQTVAFKGALFTGTSAAVSDSLAIVPAQGGDMRVDMDQVFLANASAVTVLMTFVYRMQGSSARLAFHQYKTWGHARA